MKCRITLLCILFSSSFIVACIAQPPRLGGYVKASRTQQEVVDAADFAIRAMEKAMQEAKGGQSTTLKLVKILRAEEQVVAGMNYRLTLKVKVNGIEKRAEAVVWWQAWRKPDPYELTSWTWSDPGTSSNTGACP
ncbi:MAG: cystatin domain-containing protein [Geobacteraceae bacterium]